MRRQDIGCATHELEDHAANMTDDKGDGVAERGRTYPLLSIVIPALRPDLELRRCVDSIRLACEDRQEVEVVLVVPTRHVVTTAGWFPDELVVGESRPSIYGAMNDGIRASSGRYLYFVGKDDIVLPGFGQAIAHLKSGKPSILFFDVYWGSEGVYRGYPSRWRLLARNLCHQGIVYSRAAIEHHGPYVRRMKVQADHYLNIKVLWDSQLRARVEYIACPLAWYSGAGFSQTSRDPVFWRLYPATMRRYVGHWAGCLLIVYRKLRGH